MPDSARSSGFTLVELLVAMAILGVLISAVVTLSGAFLGYSRHANVINTGIAELNDVSGYLATNARRALRGLGCQNTVGTAGNPNDPAVNCGVQSSVAISYGGSSFACSTTSADGPCIALVVPVVDRSTETSDITGFELLAYRVIPLSSWAADPGVAAGWDGADTPTLLEYRADLGCGTTCAQPPANPTAVTATYESLVATDLFLEDENGLSMRPFQVVTDPLSPDLKLQSVTFRLRTRGAGLERDVILPSGNALVVTATSRP
ncbi:MAG: prepilin-type N-terminal cleavage/methylation domain-containing protein [Truepera sp.]|jgi:prepilin-type N-terminal cleavage/methylation domain-containing protein|nr:prepilin-type N-terminal cleavage/methylation domain-containing protein [Truepera sp.]